MGDIRSSEKKDGIQDTVARFCYEKTCTVEAQDGLGGTTANSLRAC